jgi:protein-tyrosine phosphatase
MKIQVIFVCLGNICRSPGAEAVFKALIEKEGLSVFFEIDSAGTGAWYVGEKADHRMRMSARKRGYNVTSLSRKFQPSSDFERFDYVIGMDDENIRTLKTLARDKSDLAKIYKMTDFSLEYGYHGIPDPYYGGDEGFELVLDLLEDACRGFLETLRETGQLNRSFQPKQI